MSADSVVDHPPHYTAHPSGVECIQVTEHMNFCLGNAVKYIWRAGQKGDAREDLRKAVWYLQREIARLDRGRPMPEQRIPVNIEAERSVLSGLLTGGADIDSLNPALLPPDFLDLRHRAIFEGMLALHADGVSIDIVSLSGELTRRGTMAAAGGAAYIGALYEAGVGSHFNEHALEVRDNAALRELVLVAGEIESRARAEAKPASVISYAEERIFAIGAQRERGEPLQVGPLLAGAFDQVERACKLKCPVTGVTTGFDELDNILGGMQRSDLIIVAARPSMGKTSLALNIGVNASVSEQKYSVLMFSLEMSRDQLVSRLLSSEARVDSYSMRAGRLKEADWPRLTAAGGVLFPAKFFIDDTATSTVAEIRSKSRRIRARHGLDLVIVDYLQLMGGKGQNREQEVAKISRGLKGLARELNVPILALSQLSRALEARQDKRPMLSDLRESGSLEQDADVVIFVYRPFVYNLPSNPDYAEIIIGKQRNGPIGSVDLTFDKSVTRFDNLARVKPYGG